MFQALVGRNQICQIWESSTQWRPALPKLRVPLLGKAIWSQSWRDTRGVTSQSSGSSLPRAPGGWEGVLPARKSGQVLLSVPTLHPQGPQAAGLSLGYLCFCLRGPGAASLRAGWADLSDHIEHVGVRVVEGKQHARGAVQVLLCEGHREVILQGRETRMAAESLLRSEFAARVLVVFVWQGECLILCVNPWEKGPWLLGPIRGLRQTF